jgi:transcriptional regulator with XRE-family HTH domain
MTPFGERLRALRAERGITLKEMAAALQVSSAYLSALEHGHRGRPTDGLIHQICGYFGLIWDDAEALHHLAEISHPRVTIDTAGLSPTATRLAHRLAKNIAALDEDTLALLLSQVESDREKPE